MRVHRMKTWLSRFPAQDSAFIPLCLQQSRGWLVSRGFRTPPTPPPPESGSSWLRPHPAWWVTSCPVGLCTFWNAPWTHCCLQIFPAAWFFRKDHLPLSSSLERKFHPSSNIEVSENYPGAVKWIFLYVMLSESFIGSFATNVMTISFVLQTPHPTATFSKRLQFPWRPHPCVWNWRSWYVSNVYARFSNVHIYCDDVIKY